MAVSRLAAVSLLFERYLLSLFFLYYAYRELAPIRRQAVALAAPAAPLASAFPDLVRHLLVLLFDVVVGLLLLVGRRPVVPPQARRDVLVPLAANFFYLAYNVADLAPPALTGNLLPPSWRAALGLAALYLGLLGFALATWAVAHLGRSFAVLVSVRQVVVSGPYRHVRHPIYLSYLLQMLGLLCVYGSLLVLFLVAAHLGLTVYRARLEEARLAAHSAEYRSYRARTGFLLPRWPGPGLSSASA